MSLDLQMIFNTEKKAYSQWETLLSNSAAETKLLYPISPLIQHTVNTLTEHYKKLAVISNLIDEKFIVHLVLCFFKRDIGLLINRCFIAELHNAKTAGVLKKTHTDARFDEFIALISNNAAIKIIFDKYPPLKKSIAICVDQFIHQIICFFTRLNKDHQEIQNNILLDNIKNYKINKMHFAGDKHQHGKRVIITSMSSKRGTKQLVYKPRDLSLVLALHHFFHWINQKTNFHFMLPHTIAKTTYGWQSFVEFKECKNKSDVDHFFYSLGGLLCLFHFLNTQDVHSENIIAHGKHPVIVDCECLLTPILIQNKKHSPRTRNLVCSSLILPIRNMSNNNYSGFDNSVIGNEAKQKLPFTTLGWKNIGTDNMAIKRVTATSILHKSRPKLNHRLVKPANFEKTFLTGFSTLYTFLLDHKKIFLSENTPINYFANCISRVIVRPTNHYAKLILESFHPTLLHDASMRENHFAFLDQTLALTPEYNNLTDSEKQSLDELNIPIFYTNTSQKHILDCDHRKMNITVTLSPLERVVHNFNHYWDKADLRIQKTIIHNSFSSLSYNKVTQNPRLVNRAVEKTARSSKEKPLKKITLKLCELIYKNTIKDGPHLSWPTIEPAGNKLTSSITNNSLYNGSLGIVYAVGLCGYFYNIDAYKKLAINHLQYLAKTATIDKLYNTIGLYDGIGGLFYLLSVFSTLDSSVNTTTIDTLVNSSASLFKENESNHDVMSGHAGFLLALIASKNQMSSAVFENHTRYCKKQLEILLTKIKHDNKFFLASYAHGITGIYYALFRLYEVTKDKSLVNIIHQFMSLENELYEKKKQRWKDFRNKKENRFSHAWCHGSIGIGLAKLALLRENLGDHNNEHMNAAITSTMKHGFHTDFSLCHGHTGSLDFLLELKQTRPELLDKNTYNNTLNFYLHHVQEKDFSFYKLKNVFVPGLFDGISGIIYYLLRIQFGNKITSILSV
jgi:type 2 lantibiotic biosynthesis protein LanM